MELRKVYESGTKIKYLNENDDIVFELELVDGDDYDIGDLELVEDDSQYVNLKFLYVKINEDFEGFGSKNIKSVVHSVDRESYNPDEGDICFPYLNFKFPDGHREIVDFYIYNFDEVKKIISLIVPGGDNIFDCWLNKNMLPGSNCDAWIKFENGKVKFYENYERHLLVDGLPLFGDFMGGFETNDIEVNEYNFNGDGFVIDEDGEYYILSKGEIYNLSKGGTPYWIGDAIDLMKVVNSEDRLIKLDRENFDNGEYYIFKRVVTDNVLKYGINYDKSIEYIYCGTCNVKNNYPSVEISIEKHNDDLDYIINRGNRTNFYTNNMNATVMRSYSSVSGNVCDVPKYDVNVTSYMSTKMYNDGYIFGEGSAYVGNEGNYVTLNPIDEPYWYINSDGIYVMSSNYSLNDIEFEGILSNSVSSKISLSSTDKYYIKVNSDSYLDYSDHFINIDEDNRVLYVK